MTVYLFSIFFLIGCAALLLWHEPSQAKKRVFCTLASVQWILISGLRHISVGADTYAYRWYSFDRLLAISWTDAAGMLLGTYFGSAEVKDPGYRVVVKTLQLVSQDYQVFLLLVAIIFTIPLGMFIYRYSSEPFSSFLIYTCLFSSFFAITGIRQTIATALVVLVGYRFITARRLLPFIVLSVVAFTIHKSSIVFFPFYFIATWRFERRHALWLLAVAPFAFLFRRQLIEAFGSLMGYQQYTQQFAGAGAWMFTAMLVLVVVVSLWRAPVILKDEPQARAWYNAILVALMLIPVVFVNPNAMRVVQYYSLFLMLLVPAILWSFRDTRERMLAYLVSSSLLVFLFARSVPYYLFFWQRL